MAKIDSSVETLSNLAEQSRSIRARFEPDWHLNMAFFLGDQWVYWNHGRLDRPQIPEHRLLVTDNRITPIIQTRLARLTKQHPVWTVVPNSPSDIDVNSAKLGEVVVQEKWKALHMHERLIQALEWSDICSAGFWKIYWDNTKGEYMEVFVGPDGQPLTDQNGRIVTPETAQFIPPEFLQGADLQRIAQGDVCLEVRSPFMILPDPLADSLDACEWLIEETVQSEEYVKAHYGVEMEGDTEASPGPSDVRFFSTRTYGGSSTYMGIKVFEFWAKPSSQFPDGKRVVWAKNQILFEGDNPYTELPYVMFTGLPAPGRFWPSSIVEHLREPQIELNKIKSQIMENAQRIGNPSLLKSRMANVEYSGVPGEEVLYDETTPNSVPSFLQPPEMPVYVREIPDRIENSLREISGQHEVTSSQVPAGVTAASAINLLLEQDDTRLGPMVHDMEIQLGRAGSMVLQLVATYYSDERVLKLAGEDGDWDIRTFRGEQLKGNTRVEVQAGSMFPTSKAAKQAAMMQALTLFIQNGMPLDARAMRKFFGDFEIGGLEHLFADMTEDIRQVKRENRMLAQGVPVSINEFDNHELHAAEHAEHMKSARFLQYPPEIQQLIFAHWKQHEEAIAAMQQAQLEQQIAIQKALNEPPEEGSDNE